MFHLTPGNDVADDVRAIAASQLDAALARMDDADEDIHERVHEPRKRAKKLRALVRLIRDGNAGTYRRVNADQRDTARMLSHVRDAAAAVETHEALTATLGEEALAPFAAVHEALVARRDGQALDRIEQLLPEVRERVATARWNIDGWKLPDGTAVEVLQKGYARTYGRARALLAEGTTDPTTYTWHEWRKRVKYHRYHVDLLRLAWPAVMVQREQLLHDLTDALGDDHDLAVLRADLSEHELGLDADIRDGYLALVDRQRAALQHTAVPLGRRLFAEPAADHAELALGWWRTSIAEASSRDGDLTPVIPPGD